MKGPPPKPTAIKAAEGNPGKHPLNEAELLLEPRAPYCPRWLDDRARLVWSATVKELLALGVLQRVDQIQLANLCDAYSIMVQAREKLASLPAESQMLVRTPNGAIQQNPLIGIINAQRYVIHRLSQEFGLTPAARVRLMSGDAPPPAAIGSVEDLIDGPPETRPDDPVM